MNKNTFFTICIAVTALTAATLAGAQAPSRNPHLIPFYEDVRAGVCSSTMPAVGMVTASTPLDAVLFNRTFRGEPMPHFCDPVLNPDGSQMTLGQYNTVSGRASLKCIRRGPHGVFEFNGLRPGGVYTIWTVELPSTPGPPLGVGEFGRTGADENSVVADETGAAELSAITPEEDLSIFGHVGPCMFDAPFLFEVVYHSDGMTHGGDPGPRNTWVTNARFLF